LFFNLDPNGVVAQKTSGERLTPLIKTRRPMEYFRRKRRRIGEKGKKPIGSLKICLFPNLLGFLKNDVYYSRTYINKKLLKKTVLSCLKPLKTQNFQQ
jgi:hypothetical protein